MGSAKGMRSWKKNPSLRRNNQVRKKALSLLVKNKKRKVRFESSSEDSSEDSDTGYKYCKYHGKCNHTTEQCKDIKRLITDDKRRKRKDRYNEKRDRDREYKKRRSSNYVKIRN